MTSEPTARPSCCQQFRPIAVMYNLRSFTARLSQKNTCAKRKLYVAQFRSIFHNLNVVITLILNRNIKTMEEHTLKDEYPFCQLQTVLRAYFCMPGQLVTEGKDLR